MSLNALKLSLDGLDDADAASLRSLIAAALSCPEVREVAAGRCEAMIVDPDLDGAAQVLRNRPTGALILWALRPGEAAWPGTLSLARPFDETHLCVALHVAAQIALQLQFTPRHLVEAPEADSLPEFTLSPDPPPPSDSTLLGEGDEARALDEEVPAGFDEGHHTADLFEATLDAAALDDPAFADLTPADPLDEAPDDTVTLDTAMAADVSLLDDGVDWAEPVLIDASPDAHAESPWDSRELTLAEALAELTPTSVPPVNWDAVTAAEEPTLVEAPAQEHERLRQSFEAAMVEHEQASDAAVPAWTEPAAPALPVEEVPPPPVEVSAGPVEAAAVDEDSTGQVEGTPRIEAGSAGAAAIDSLVGLAAAYREQLYREREVLVQIEDLSFHLLPYQGVCVSAARAEQLERYRGRQPLGIEIDVVVTEPDERLGESTNLVHFLWHLGVNAGGGSLLPWIPGDRPCRLMRWPPLATRDTDSPLFRVAAVLSGTPTSVTDVAQLAGADEAAVNDFVNGCSLLGYLEVLSSPAPRTRGGAPAAGPEAAGAPAARSLVGRLRQRIGLHQ
jgi:hypothetical protein